MKEIELVVIDDNISIESPLFVELEMKYGEENIKLFQNSDNGLEYIENNLNKRIIVILDVNFPAGEKSGRTVLLEIRKHTKLIPVIVWSANDGIEEFFIDFINHHAFFYLKKPCSIEIIINSLNEAEHRLEVDVATAIETWLESEDDKTQILSVDSRGKQYSAEELITEIRMQTDEGRKIEEGILELTIELLSRKIEKL